MSREGKNINLARRYAKTNGQSIEKSWQIIDRIRRDIPNSRVGKCKFLLGVTRLYLDGQLSDAASIFTLNKLLPLIGSETHIKEYDYNINGMTLSEIDNNFSGIQQRNNDDARKLSYAKKHTANTRYKIVRIPDFETAKKYNQYTEWCIGKSQNNYNIYTCDGVGLFYFCLRDDFKTIAYRRKKECPLDDYGLSMVAVSVDENGDPNTITSRWNHENGGSDHVMSKDDLEDLLGVNFYETFKPFTEEELKAKGILSLSMAIKRLDNGEDIAKIFGKDNIRPLEGSDGLYRCLYKYKSAIYNSKTNEITHRKWFDETYNFHEGLARVKIKTKGYSFINTNGQLIGNSNMWFDVVYNFHEGFARVFVNGKGYSFIDTNGQLIGNGNAWFDDVYDFVEGFAHVFKNDKGVSFINRDGQLIGNGKLWFDDVYDFVEGFARVKIEGKGWSFINRDGRLIGKGNLWFNDVGSFDEGFAVVEIKGKGWSFINTNGQLIGNGNMWFDDVNNFHEGLASVFVNGKGWLFINRDGQLIGDGKLWFDWVSDFNDGFAVVRIKDKGYSFINRDGQLIGNGKLWFDDAYDFNDGFACVYTRDKGYSYIDRDGHSVVNDYLFINYVQRRKKY